MLFNIWFGQMRPKPKDLSWANVPGDFYYRPKRPMGRLMVQRLEPQGASVEYKADSRGNINVRAPIHIKDFVSMGWPIYNGVFMEDIRPPDGPLMGCPNHSFLLWPDNPEYNRRVLEGLKQLKEA